MKIIMKEFPGHRHRGRLDMQPCCMTRLLWTGVPPCLMKV
jgi:hypothetical protein